MKEYKTITRVYSGSLRQAVEDAYKEMLQPDSEFPFIINCRNFIPGILAYDNGTQRYAIFNSIRRQLFSKYGITEYPTACALGSVGETYILSYTRARTPASFFENPNQVSAFLYPEKYGQPLFSRAGRHNNNLLISGTASIVDSETVHVGDIRAQTLQTLQNMTTLKGSPLDDSLKYHIYVKDSRDNEVVRDICYENGISGTIINVDVCRDDLLVEIEAYSKDLNI